MGSKAYYVCRLDTHLSTCYLLRPVSSDHLAVSLSKVPSSANWSWASARLRGLVHSAHSPGLSGPCALDSSLFSHHIQSCAVRLRAFFASFPSVGGNRTGLPNLICIRLWRRSTPALEMARWGGYWRTIGTPFVQILIRPPNLSSTSRQNRVAML